MHVSSRLTPISILALVAALGLIGAPAVAAPVTQRLPDPWMQPDVRAARAEQVAALINAGRCDEARIVALSGHDYSVAHKAEALCAARGQPVMAPYRTQ